jgi:tRNA pseudouridine38-40 synthase
MRIALGIEYDGSGFSGWQFQEGVPTVQRCLEAALSKVADHPVRVICAGRTDAGVHATGQVVHFDSDAPRAMRSWVYGANANLPRGVSVLWAQTVHSGFHARFAALRRSYRYIFFNRSVRPTFLFERVTWEYRPLDAERMAQAARPLLGEHDFSSYRALECQAKHPVRRLYCLNVTRQRELVILDVQANGFLHHMVRNIAGVLSAIGAGERPVEWASELLAQRDRRAGGVTAPPHGLYLTRVEYPDEFELPAGDEPRLPV